MFKKIQQTSFILKRYCKLYTLEKFKSKEIQMKLLKIYKVKLIKFYSFKI